MIVNGLPSDGKLRSDGVLIARETVSPELVTNDYHISGVCLFFFHLKIATQHRVDLEHRKEVRRDPHSLHALCLFLMEQGEAVHFVLPRSTQSCDSAPAYPARRYKTSNFSVPFLYSCARVRRRVPVRQSWRR